MDISIWKMKNNQHYKPLKPIALVYAATGFFFALLSFSEFYNVRIAGKGGYPFGSVNDTPWYYQNATIYANYNLVSFLVLLIVSAFIICGMLKKNMRMLLTGIIVMTLSFLAMAATSQ